MRVIWEYSFDGETLIARKNLGEDGIELIPLENETKLGCTDDKSSLIFALASDFTLRPEALHSGLGGITDDHTSEELVHLPNID